MRLTVIGSGTVVPSPDRVCSAYYLETGPHRILFDCGPGALHHMARFDVPWDRLTHIALTHFHTDHIGGLPILFFSLEHGLPEKRRDPLQVTGPEGTLERFRRLADAFGDHLLDPGFEVRVRELRHGEAFALDAATTLRAHRTPHTDASIAYRLDAPGAAFGYTGDTGPSDELGTFLHGVDTLLAECSLPDDLAIPTHLSPSSVAALARRAAPRRLLLTHIYPQLAFADARGPEGVAARVRDAGWGGEAAVVEDGLSLDVAAGPDA